MPLHQVWTLLRPARKIAIAVKKFAAISSGPLIGAPPALLTP
jgi:hypothetical protein